MKILTVVGARPQFIKASVLSRAIASHHQAGGEPILEEIVHTGQHYDHGMSRVFFDEMEIPEPAAHLGVGSGPHGATTGAMLAGVEREIRERRPDRVVVFGDTNSTLAGALAAAKLHVPVAHVEAGLRSFNRRMPEELNRILTDHLADLLFCPSETSRRHLEREGIRDGVHVVGDVLVDSILHHRRRAEPPPFEGDFALATIHRAENTDDPARLRGILAGLEGSPVPVILPLHPRTRRVLGELAITPPRSVRCTEPLSYLQTLGHIEACRFVLTDSGGLQKEAYVLGKRCVTLRDETEWTELVEAGANRLTGTDPDRIRDAFAWALEPLGPIEPLYGGGSAGPAIVAILLESAR